MLAPQLRPLACGLAVSWWWICGVSSQVCSLPPSARLFTVSPGRQFTGYEPLSLIFRQLRNRLSLAPHRTPVLRRAPSGAFNQVLPSALCRSRVRPLSSLARGYYPLLLGIRFPPLLGALQSL